jgi:hypothetical protein
MILTAEGRHKEVAIPARPRKRISSYPVRERPQAKVKALCSKEPTRYITRLPTTSATEPERRSVQPHVRENIEAGLRFC